jgi:fatty acid hydroxylase family protein
VEAAIRWLYDAPLWQAIGVLLAENLLMLVIVVAAGNWTVRRFADRRVALMPPPVSRLELAATTSTILLNTAVTVVGLLLWRSGIIRFPTDVGLWAWLDILVLLLVMDLAMYLLHRVAHHPWFFGFLHEFHHRFDQPRPLTLFILMINSRMCRFGVALTLCGIIAMECRGDPSSESGAKRPFYGAVVGQQLVGGIQGGPLGKLNTLFIEDLAVKVQPKRVRFLLNDWLWEKSNLDRVFRWRIQGDFLWCIQQGFPGDATSPWFTVLRLPLSKLPREETKPLKQIPGSFDAPHEWGDVSPDPHEWSNDVDSGMSYFCVAQRVQPLDAAVFPNGSGRNIHFDLWPMADRHCLVFAIHEPTDHTTGFGFHVAADHRYLQVAEYRFSAVSSDGVRIWWRGVWKAVENIDCTFKEPFFAVSCGADYLFVTQSGAVYQTKKSETRKNRTTALVRPATQNPIVAMIQDAGLTRIQAFTQTSTFVIRPDLREEKFTLGLRADWGEWGEDAVYLTLRWCAERFVSDTHQ